VTNLQIVCLLFLCYGFDLLSGDEPADLLSLDISFKQIRKLFSGCATISLLRRALLLGISYLSSSLCPLFVP
jgi:hypothetical protein